MSVRIEGAPAPDVLTPEVVDLVAALTRVYGPRIDERLAARNGRQLRLDAGERLDFLPETAEIRDSDWTVAETPPDLLDRRVEITGPVDRKMVINALNSGASCYMADFEDSTTPTWENLLDGQRNLRDAVAGTIRHSAGGKEYVLGEKPATLLVRPRGLHLPERHLLVDDRPAPGAMFDFATFMVHNARALVAKGTGPYFYLPKLESHLEAGVWRDAIAYAEDALGLTRGTVKVTVLIETLPAAFELHEILWALRDHIVGLNCGRWDYIFSFIKRHRAHAAFLTPDRSAITMEQPALRAYTRSVVEACHSRGAHAMGGMAAQIPLKDDPERHAAAMAKVRADKLREVTDGHDGTWVAHPGLVPLAREIFDAHMPGPHQRHVVGRHPIATRDQLLEVPTGAITEAGLAHDVRVAVRYLESWLRGVGCVPIEGLMEDAATAEISRVQVWHWLKHGAFDVAALDRALENETGALTGGRFAEARTLFRSWATAPELVEFLTTSAYDRLST